jgi:hypothetical protein
VSYALADPALAHALRDLVDLVLEVDRSVACQPVANPGLAYSEVS